MLWFNASDQQNAYSKQVVKVPLEVRNLPASLVVTELPANVEVQVEGAWSVVENVDAQDFSAFVGLESYKAGKHEAPVEVTVPPGVRLVNVTPSTIVVQLASMTSVQLPIVAKVEGGAASGFRILTPVVEPAEAIIRGPETLLKKVQSARVNVTLNNIREDYVKILPVTLDGSSEDESFNISIAPALPRFLFLWCRRAGARWCPWRSSFRASPWRAIRWAGSRWSLKKWKYPDLRRQLIKFTV